MDQLKANEIKELAETFGYEATSFNCDEIKIYYHRAHWITFYSQEQFVFWLMGICSIQKLRTNPDDFIVYYLSS